MLRNLKKIILTFVILIGVIVGIGLTFITQKTAQGLVEGYLHQVLDPWSEPDSLTITLKEFHWGGIWQPLSFKTEIFEVCGLRQDLRLQADSITLRMSVSQFLLGRIEFSSLSVGHLTLYHKDDLLIDGNIRLTPSWRGDKIVVAGAGHRLDLLGQFLNLPFLQNFKMGKVNFHGNILSRPGHIIGRDVRLIRGDTQLQSSFDVTASTPWQGIWQDGGHLNVKLIGQVSLLPVNDLAHVWPETLAPKPRAWVIQNLHEGQVKLATLNMTSQVDLVQQGRIEVAKIDELKGEIRAEGVTVNYLDPMLPVTGATGICKYNDKQFMIHASGEVNGIKVQKSEIIISGLDQKDQSIIIQLENEGPVEKCLTFLKSKPLELTRELGLDGLHIQGQAHVKTKLEFPLQVDVPLQQIDVSAQAQIQKGQAQSESGLLYYLPLQEGCFDLSVDKKTLHLEGSANLGKWAGKLIWNQYFLPQGSPYQQRLELKMTADWPKTPSWGGTIFVEGWLETHFSGKIQGQIKATFDRFALSIPWLSWTKEEGHHSEGIIKWSADQGKGAINQFDITGPNLDIRATGQFDSNKLKQLKFSVFKVGDVSSQVRVIRKQPEFYQIHGELRQFDISRFVADTDLLTQSTGDFSLPFEVGLNLTIQHLTAGLGLTLRDVHADMRWSRDRLGLIDIHAKHIPNKSPFVLRLTPAHESGVQDFNLQTGSAGEVLELFGTGYDLQGGQMTLVGHKKSVKDSWVCDGEAHLENVTVREAPVLAHLLSLASFQGLIHLFTGQGIHFRYGHGFFTLSPTQLQFNNAELSGAALGIFFSGNLNRITQRVNFQGELVPIYGVNQLLANIPLLGQALSGGNQEGIFRTAFTIAGTKNKPEVKVNPLTTLAPGGVRAALEAGRKVMKKKESPSDSQHPTS